jgi:ferritin-like metal-binding protein YciE
MKLNTLADLLHHELKDLFSAENQLLKALPKMAKAATNAELAAGFETHLEETRGQVERLNQIARILDLSLTGHKCKAMEGLVEEGSELISEDADPSVKDAGLIGAAQRVEHYEMAGYGTAAAFARKLGHDDVAELLDETLEEEKATDAKLTKLAETAVNSEAQAAGDSAK